MVNTASDYLIELISDSKCDKWVRKVIKAFLQKDYEMKVCDLAEDLIGLTDYVVPTEEKNIFDSNSAPVMLKELLHRSGVNALSENQKIRFNPQVNVIYGLNGSGKSSYFRILNEMIGGDNETPIRPNIYLDSTKPVSVELKYVYKGSEKTANWNGSERGLSDLKSMRVFDSAYTRDFLRKRTSDELVVKPYGLHIFADLVSFIDTIAIEAENIIAERIKAKPSIDTKEMVPDIAELFNDDSFQFEKLEHIEEIIKKGDVNEKSLEDKKSEIDNMKLGDPKDKITLLNSYIVEAEKIKKHFENCSLIGNNFMELTVNDIRMYQKLTDQSNMYKQKIEVLKEIPGTETELWREFISKGIEYGNNCLVEEECPFCHQKYSAHAKEIVDAYVLFLENDSLVKLNNIVNSIATNVAAINRWNILIDYDNKKWSKELLLKIESSVNVLKTFKNSLLKMIESRKQIIIDKLDFSDIIMLINDHIKEISSKIKVYSEDSIGRREAIKSLENDYKEMKTRHSIISQKNEIINLFSVNSWAMEKRKVVADIANLKKKISTLSKKAHNELLTEQLQKEFVSNLRKLNISNIDIELLGKNSNGIQQTELAIRKNKDITTILSEGEQKATALALYLAEIILSKNKSTIIFDDPVNSLDHRMMQSLADLLMSIENQVVVFTHNKMFLDCFECTKLGHICKGLESACSKTKGKHIFLYETQSEGQSKKGVILEKNVQTLNYYVKEVGKLLTETPFDKFDDACLKLRRGVETAIDEIVFNNQIPTKLSNKNSRINWDELKKICNDEALINGLQEIHGRVSGGELHNGSEREENTLDKEEIERLYVRLKVLCKIP